MALTAIGAGPFGPQRPQRILVCDDERHIVRLIQVNLERQGHTVTCAFNGREAMELIAAADPPFDWIILDIMLPYVDGFEVLPWIRSREETRDTWVALIGTQKDFESFQSATYQPNKYVMKPFNPLELLW